MDKLFCHKNKVVLVTGAKGQLGAMLCEAYLNMGAKVIGWDITNDGVAIKGVNYFSVDIAKKRSIETTMNRVFETYGRIDVLINNAGVSTFEPFEERPEVRIDWVMDVNLKGTFLCIQSFIKEYDQFKQRKGNIINIGSVYGFVCPDFRIYSVGDRKNSEIYGATKAGVIQMTKYFAVHLAERNIRVNAISPGGIYNPKQPQSIDFVENYSFRCPMRRMANVNEMVGAAIYLSSDSASYTNGHNLIIDGGMSCW